MGIQINVGDHVSPDPNYVRVPPYYLPALRWARDRANKIAKNMPSADRYFLRLPLRRTLSSILADSSIWINYHATLPHYGATSRRFPGEIALGRFAFVEGRWMLLGTLLHELAHVAGADGRTRSAEQTLVHCGLGRPSEISGVDDPKTPFDPRVRG